MRCLYRELLEGTLGQWYLCLWVYYMCLGVSPLLPVFLKAPTLVASRYCTVNSVELKGSFAFDMASALLWLPAHPCMSFCAAPKQARAVESNPLKPAARRTVLFLTSCFLGKGDDFNKMAFLANLSFWSLVKPNSETPIRHVYYPLESSAGHPLDPFTIVHSKTLCSNHSGLIVTCCLMVRGSAAEDIKEVRV